MGTIVVNVVLFVIVVVVAGAVVGMCGHSPVICCHVVGAFLINVVIWTVVVLTPKSLSASQRAPGTKRMRARALTTSPPKNNRHFDQIEAAQQPHGFSEPDIEGVEKAIAGPRRVRITLKDIQPHGFTDNCPRCSQYSSTQR